MLILSLLYEDAQSKQWEWDRNQKKEKGEKEHRKFRIREGNSKK